jgi:hypothetical protein
MMRGKGELYGIVIALVLLQASFVLWSSLESITGGQVSSTEEIYSEAQVMKYISISMSGNLSAGIEFGTITVIPVTSVNATKNYNSTVNENWHNETLYWINVSSDSSVNADLCVKADPLTTSGLDEIGLGNYTWADNVTNNETWPSIGDAEGMTTSYVMGSANITPGNNNYYRFWLSVPGGQPAGTYNNTVYFKAVEEGIGCGL